MNIEKNSPVSSRCVIHPDGENSGNSKNTNINLDQELSKKTEVKVGIEDDAESDENDSIGINQNKINFTSPDTNRVSQHPSPMTSTGRNMSFSHVKRKSFLGELKNLLTFNKKQDDLLEESMPSFIHQNDPTANEFENKKVALQNRRKQVFQKQDNGSEGSSTEEPSHMADVGSTVCYYLNLRFI